jgi:hypothetical protein
MYRGESMEPYTVCDNFIVTNERIALVPIVASQITPDVDMKKLEYIVLRLLLLYNDMLQARYEVLSTNEEIVPVLDEASTVLGYTESDVNFIEHKRLHMETEQLFTIVSKLREGGNFASAITETNQLTINKKTWTNDTVELFLADRFAVRNNAFGRTFSRIREIQDMLLMYFPPPDAGFAEGVSKPAPPSTTNPKSVKRSAVSLAARTRPDRRGANVQTRRAEILNTRRLGVGLDGSIMNTHTGKGRKTRRARTSI